MVGLKIPSPAMARAIWQSMPSPSTRRVAKFRQAGRSVSHQTINRWRNQRWRPSEREQQHPLEAALELLDDAVPLLTGDPTTTAKTLVQESPEREALEHLSDAEEAASIIGIGTRWCVPAGTSGFVVLFAVVVRFVFSVRRLARRLSR